MEKYISRSKLKNKTANPERWIMLIYEIMLHTYPFAL